MTELDWKVMWCSRHLDPYRAAWPAGAVQAMVALFGAAARMPAVADAAHGDADQIPAALARFAPICCFVGKQALDRIYAETLPAADEG
jgi:hypothetical protein